MGLLGKKKDWNVIAVIFERPDRYQVNGNRGKGAAAEKIRDGARRHERTIFWAVFDQKGAFLEGAPGPADNHITPATLERLQRELPRIKTVRQVLDTLEQGKTNKMAMPMEWDGYPAPESEAEEGAEE